ncbi:TPA: hypothetical protein I7678_20585 [Vibrio vulnificus]|nr:hypothetical protein [Vibrio vulnificus]HAS8151657.1 hypothetical protein [Vibrio vulnificus]
MQENIFYSWQSDCPNNTNRGLIKDALEVAVKTIKDDETISIDPVVDRDTFGVPGSPDISETIFSKIEEASVFVCDVSFIDSSASRKTPNPNVLIELGYAIKVLGWRRIVLVMNTEYGDPGELPFDIRSMRTLTYKLHTDAEKAPARNGLVKQLTAALKLIFEKDGKRVFHMPSVQNHKVDNEVLLKASRRIISMLIEDSPLSSSEIIERLTAKGRFDEFDVEDAIDEMVQHEVIKAGTRGGYELSISHDYHFKNKLEPALNV